MRQSLSSQHCSLLATQDPICSLIFNPSAVRDGFPCCHAYHSSRDGCDLIVGIANGEGEQQLSTDLCSDTRTHVSIQATTWQQQS